MRHLTQIFESQLRCQGIRISAINQDNGPFIRGHRFIDRNNRQAWACRRFRGLGIIHNNVRGLNGDDATIHQERLPPGHFQRGHTGHLGRGK